MNIPEISIIVPVYNVEKYLNKCIDSILNQTFKDFELILINDGSTDNSLEICNSYQKKDNRIKVINKNNGGLSSARNAGIDIARGNYIGFIDSDDHIHEKMYEILHYNAVKYSSDMVICKERNVYEDETIDCKSTINKYNTYQLDNIESLTKLYEARTTTFVYAWNKLYKRSMFHDTRYPEGKIYEDEFLTPKLIYQSNTITYVNCELYYYLQRKGSIVNSKFSTKKFDKVDALESNVKFFKDKNIRNIYFLVQKAYVDLFFWNEYSAKSQLENINRELNILRRKFKNHNMRIIMNPLISTKQKIMITIYNVSPKAYYYISKSL